VLVREMVQATAPVPALGTGFATPPGPRGGATALYNHTDPERVERIVGEHIVGGRIVREFVERPGDPPAVQYSPSPASTTKDSDP
jgi:(2Fe-2S) ferredoxin